jgi:hypothetical protein
MCPVRLAPATEMVALAGIPPGGRPAACIPTPATARGSAGAMHDTWAVVEPDWLAGMTISQSPAIVFPKKHWWVSEWAETCVMLRISSAEIGPPLRQSSSRSPTAA